MNALLYDTIGLQYDLTRKADPFLLSRIIDLLKAANDKRYLDIGCGTGNYTIALKEKGFDISGLEPSEKMRNAAQLKNNNIEWLDGTADAVPLENQTMDGAIAILTIHHWNELKQCFKEINRVLKDKGKLILFTSSPEQMKGYWLNHYFPAMLNASITKMPGLADVKTTLMEAGFDIIATEKYFIANDLEDHFLYAGKNRPELYFDAAIRNGISSFASLANEDEVKSGLCLLAKDIEANQFGKLQQQYENDHGDYLFLVAEKNQTII